MPIPFSRYWNIGRQTVRACLRRTPGQTHGGVRYTDSPDSIHHFFYELKQSAGGQMRLYPEYDLELLQQFVHQNAEWTAETIRRADKVCSHIFSLLGSNEHYLGSNVDWQVDWMSGRRWPKYLHGRWIRPARFPGGYDIKLPWDLSACHHWVWLGQAYWLTGDERYATEYVSQAENWIHSNPYLFGVNWVSPMAASIRAVNWLVSLKMFINSPAVSEAFFSRFLKVLWQHGLFIRNNLEGQPEGHHNGNHYIANLTALLFLGATCQVFCDAHEWLSFSYREIWRELEKQTLEDGFSYEGSTAYHRFVTEMFLCSYRLCEMQQLPVSETTRMKLLQLIELLGTIVKPNGTTPQIGDSDNGRLHRFATWSEPEKEWSDYRYLHCTASVLFSRNDLAVDAHDCWQDAYWLLGRRAIVERDLAHRPEHRCNQEPPAGGLAVQRHQDCYSLLNLGRQSQTAKLGHTHNDLLSIEVSVGQDDFIVDSGTYTYTRDYAARNLFRSVKSHNTITVDDTEIVPFDPRACFHMPYLANAQLCSSISAPEYEHLYALHDAYRRLELPVTHHRQVYFDKQHKFWIILDTLEGLFQHFTSRFHLATPEVVNLDGKQGAYMAKGSGAGYLAVVPIAGSGDFESAVRVSKLSQSYGHINDASVIEYTGNCKPLFSLAIALLPLAAELDFAERWPKVTGNAGEILNRLSSYGPMASLQPFYI